MTIKQIANQIYSLSKGNLNHEKFTKSQLYSYLKNVFEFNVAENPKTIWMEIQLPDGWWNFKIEYLPNVGKNIYDYTIPENREQEKRMMARN